mmetsp:Transcript_5506/g.8840  ORF Transcript_5506/g.8840 Transcript_5506/m.8840 type:complete len:201 (+) Transcript_5506:1154-1756(+)
MIKSGGLYHLDPAQHVIGAQVGLRHLHRLNIDVTGQHRGRPDGRRRHRQHGGAAPDIHDPFAGEPGIGQPIHRLQTAQRGAMMSGAKGHRRLDQQRMFAIWHFVGIVAAIDEKAPRLDRGQFAAHMGDPIGFGQFRHGKGLGPHRGGEDQQGRLVGAFGEIATHFPQARPVLDLKDADAGGLRLHPLQRCAKGGCVGFAA